MDFSVANLSDSTDSQTTTPEIGAFDKSKLTPEAFGSTPQQEAKEPGASLGANLNAPSGALRLAFEARGVDIESLQDASKSTIDDFEDAIETASALEVFTPEDVRFALSDLPGVSIEIVEILMSDDGNRLDGYASLDGTILLDSSLTGADLRSAVVEELGEIAFQSVASIERDAGGFLPTSTADGFSQGDFGAELAARVNGDVAFVDLGDRDTVFVNGVKGEASNPGARFGDPDFFTTLQSLGWVPLQPGVPNGNYASPNGQIFDVLRFQQYSHFTASDLTMFDSFYQGPSQVSISTGSGSGSGDFRGINSPVTTELSNFSDDLQDLATPTPVAAPVPVPEPVIIPTVSPNSSLTLTNETATLTEPVVDSPLTVNADPSLLPQVYGPQPLVPTVPSNAVVTLTSGVFEPIQINASDPFNFNGNPDLYGPIYGPEAPFPTEPAPVIGSIAQPVSPDFVGPLLVAFEPELIDPNAPRSGPFDVDIIDPPFGSFGGSGGIRGDTRDLPENFIQKAVRGIYDGLTSLETATGLAPDALVAGTAGKIPLINEPIGAFVLLPTDQSLGGVVPDVDAAPIFFVSLPGVSGPGGTNFVASFNPNNNDFEQGFGSSQKIGPNGTTLFYNARVSSDFNAAIGRGVASFNFGAFTSLNPVLNPIIEGAATGAQARLTTAALAGDLALLGPSGEGLAAAAIGNTSIEATETAIQAIPKLGGVAFRVSYDFSTGVLNSGGNQTVLRGKERDRAEAEFNKLAEGQNVDLQRIIQFVQSLD